MTARRSILEALFRIRPQERSTALLLFVQCFCTISAAFVVGRTLGTTLFLQRVDPAYLPYTYGLSAIGTGAAALVYARVADRFPRHTTIQVTALVFAAACVVLRLTLSDSLLFLALVYVFFDIVGDLSLIQFWTLASDVMNARQGKRLFSFVAAGGTIGGALTGAAMGSTVHLIGTSNLFYVVAVLLLAGAAAGRRVGRLHRLEPPASARGAAPSSLVGDLRSVFGDRYTMALAALFAVTTTATVLVDYQWKVAARGHYLGDEAGLAAYFSFFYVFSSGAALFLQLFVTSRLLERFGLRAGLTALPGALLTALSSALAVASATAFFWAVTIAKSIDGALRYSINDTSTLVLYRPIPGHQRGRAKALLGGVLKPGAAGLAGLGIAGLAVWLDATRLTWVTAPVILAWIALAALMRRLYVRRLAAELESRSYLAGDELSIDAHTRQTLLAALDGDPPQQLGALGLLASFDELPFELPLARLLGAEDQEVAARTLELLGTHGVPGSLAEVERAMDHRSPEVRGRAIAVALRHGDLGSVLMAAERLTRLLDDPDPAARCAGAEALALVAEPRFFAPIARLLDDADPSVRVAAARAAARAPNPALAAPLVALLEAPATRPAARGALAAFGAAATAALAEALDGAAAIPAAQTLADIGGVAAERALAARLGLSDGRLARECARALGRLAERGPVAVDRAAVGALLDAEMTRADEVRRLQLELSDAEPALLGDALVERWRVRAGHVLALSSAIAPGQPFREIERAALGADASRRADALELLDNMPLGAFKARLLALFEEAPAVGTARSRTARLVELLEDRDPWFVACAIYELALSGDLTEDMAADHPDALVQSTREFVISGVLVKRVGTARSIRMVGGGVAREEGGGSAMISTVERVLFLKGVDFLADIPSELLVGVAQLAVEEYFDPGATLMKQGDGADCLYLVVEGIVAVAFGGKEVAQLGRKECVGEMSLLDSEPRSATVVAKTQTLTLRVDQEPFFELLAERPQLARGLIAVLSRRLRKMMRDNTV